MLAFAILGLAGCALALIAVALDWHERGKWTSYTLDFGDEPLPGPRVQWPEATSWTTQEPKA